MALQVLISGGQLHMKISCDASNSQPGSPQFIITVIGFCKEHLERFDETIVRLLVYKCIEDLIPTAFQYEGDIQPEIIQPALDQINSLQQDPDLPENLQKILDELRCFYEGGANRDQRGDAAYS
ncbi:hypothetical protein V491_00654 [Pseudogymnoascus sp. VKM F-3775]|nr:hypothetical protein V491_00654 [Pseudogymnoascus sp. VKM F-3775]